MARGPGGLNLTGGAPEPRYGHANFSKVVLGPVSGGHCGGSVAVMQMTPKLGTPAQRLGQDVVRAGSD